MGGRRPRRHVLGAGRARVLAAHDADVQAGAGAHVPRLLQPRVPCAVAGQQLPRHDDHQPAGPRCLNPALAGRVYNFPVAAVGNEDLVEESLDAYEIGYSGVIANRATVTAAFYVNDSEELDLLHAERRRTGQPIRRPAGRCRRSRSNSSTCRAAFGPGNGLPSSFTYLNFGKVRQKGLELGVDSDIANGFTGFVNYSFQPEPEPSGFDICRDSTCRRATGSTSAPTTRAAGCSATCRSATRARRTGRTCSTARYHGTPMRITLVNGSVGYRVARRQLVTASLKVDQPVQPGDPAAHLRRRHEAAGRRRAPHAVLRTRRPRRPGRRGVCFALS